MAAPGLTFSVSGNRVSDKAGFDHISVLFSSNIAYTEFQCRATKFGEDWGIGRGELIASFSRTPADTQRSFEVYDDYLVHGDGEYRISLFARGEDGSWNDNWSFIPLYSDGMIAADGQEFLVAKNPANPNQTMFVLSDGDSLIEMGGNLFYVRLR